MSGRSQSLRACRSIRVCAGRERICHAAAAVVWRRGWCGDGSVCVGAWLPGCGSGWEVPACWREVLSWRATARGGLVSSLRVWLVGFGAVGRWLAGVLDAQGGRIASRYGCAITVVGVANARDGFVYDERGLDLGSVLAAAESGRPITDQRGARAWPGAIEGLRATEADLLVEVTASRRPAASRA